MGKPAAINVIELDKRSRLPMVDQAQDTSCGSMQASRRDAKANSKA